LLYAVALAACAAANDTSLVAASWFAAPGAHLGIADDDRSINEIAALIAHGRVLSMHTNEKPIGLAIQRIKNLAQLGDPLTGGIDDQLVAVSVHFALVADYRLRSG